MHELQTENCKILQYERQERLDFPPMTEPAEQWEHAFLSEEQAALPVPIQPLRFQETHEEMELDHRQRAPAAFWRQPVYTHHDSGPSTVSAIVKVESMLCNRRSNVRTYLRMISLSFSHSLKLSKTAI